ncbi:MAG: hypothetical protein JEZ06_08070 [Anaerolineaceae bacterium]|nr:hypothetical protein [Anaerolineaceae bacterium]
MINLIDPQRLIRQPEDRHHFYGVVVGLVTNNRDPESLNRVKVRYPWLSDTDESHWARVLTPMAGEQRGFYFLPEVDDEVLIAFEHGMIEFPYVIGALWNGVDKPPESNSDGKNSKRMIKSRSGHIIRFDDTDGAEKIELIDSSGNNTIIINAAENTITISANADIMLQSTDGKLTLNGATVEIVSQAEVKIEAGGDMDMKASGQMNINGQIVNIN